MELELKHPPQALLIPEAAQKAVLTGMKRISIREGSRDYRADRPFFLCYPNNSFCVSADLTSVRHCKAREVTEEERRDDGYGSLREMVQDLRRFYPHLTKESKVTVLRWNNVEGSLVDQVE
jgi:hypothetical protein